MVNSETKAYLIFQAAVAIAAADVAGSPSGFSSHFGSRVKCSLELAEALYQKTIGALPAPTPNFLRPKPEEEPEMCSHGITIGEHCHECEAEVMKCFIPGVATAPPSEEGIPTPPASCMHGKPIGDDCQACKEFQF